jgi:hypothetical protein
MNHIVRAITTDGLVGYDQFDQLVHVDQREPGFHVTRFVRDVRGHTCVLCGRGWEMNGPSFGDQCVVRHMEKLAHSSCMDRHQIFEEFFTVHRALCTAILFSGMREVPNAYWAGKKPSYQADAIVETGREIVAQFTVGMRKRVWEVSVTVKSDEPFPLEELMLAFEGEKVTKSFGENSVLIHAWDETKLAEYLKNIATLVGVGRDEQIAARTGRDGL